MRDKAEVIMKSKYFISAMFILSTTLLSGCSLMPDILTTESEQEETLVIMDLNTQETITDHKAVSYFDEALNKNVNDYAKWLIQDLITNLDLPSNDDVFVITDIALLDSDLNKTNHFGRQFTEAMIHEVNRSGFSVIDVKNTGFIRFSDSGDVFFQSRNYLELSTEADVTNVITGTMTRHRGGYLINGKMVNLSSSALVSTAQIFVPHSVVDSVIKEDVPVVIEEKPGIKLKPFKASE
jgi:TolB-like protein